jgi:energy-coupling factor transporter ATP-binding protein EcfA2
MPIIKKNDITPERPVIIVLYGTPGSGKTSVATTADTPIVIDTDRGYDRAVQRVDTLTASKWEDVLTEAETLKSYKTVIVDTAKAALDDYLSAYVCEKNYKLKNNGLKRFGQMADEFKQFVNSLRANGQDIIFICHDKETLDGDTIKHAPDCTGQSKDLLIRIADQVGYVFIQNKQRVINFEPLDNFVGKNVAQLGQIQIPDAPSKEFDTCMADIIKTVKQSIQSKSEAQRKAQEMLAQLRENLAEADTEKGVEVIMKQARDLPPILKAPFFAEAKEALAAKGFMFDAEKKKFVKEQSNEPTETAGQNDGD